MAQRSGERSAACSVCGKTFARTDTLLRHEKSHHATEDRGPVHRVTSGTFRACKSCAAARSRCSGGKPCGRCNLRGIDCYYPNKRRKAAGTDVVPGKVAHGENDGQASAGVGELVFSINPSAETGQESASQSLYSATTDPGIGRDTYTAGLHTGIFDNQLDASNTQFQSLQHAVPFPLDLQHQAPNLDYSNFEDPINWIPLSVYPSPYDVDLEQDFSFLPPLSNRGTADYTAIEALTSTTNLFDAPNPSFFPHEPTYHYTAPVTSFIGAITSPASSSSDGYRHHDSNPPSARTSMSAPENKRKKSRPAVVPDLFTKPRTSRHKFAFPRVDEPVAGETGQNPDGCYCTQENYATISAVFRSTCLGDYVQNRFENATFPSQTGFNAYLEMYMEQFQSTFPIIHPSTFGQKTAWIVTLAAAAIGSSYCTDVNVAGLRQAFQEFLRRAIHQYAEKTSNPEVDMDLAVARILNLIGLVQSDRSDLRELVPRYHAELSSWLLESGLLQLVATTSQPLYMPNADPDIAWLQWIKSEVQRRIGYMAWLLDCSLGYIANARPLCNIDDARTSLPANEKLWEAGSATTWIGQALGMTTSPSLCEALESLYSSKRADPSLSELAQTVLVHGLYQRTWEIGTHIKQPLSEWVPTGKARGFLSTPTKDNFWLPLYPMYANWRNSACDCLDYLHWHAMGAVAKGSGFEPPVVLQLHLARIILLTPFQEIQDLLFSLLGKVDDSPKASFYVHDGSYQPRNNAKLAQIRKITWRWLREDQHKARLAVIHSGSVFWYVRRYSGRSFYEPIAVYLASIVLWVYGTYKTAALDRAVITANGKRVGGPSGPDAEVAVQPSRAERKLHRVHPKPKNGKMAEAATVNEGTDPDLIQIPETASESTNQTSSEDEPEFIHLDRPCDEDIVQDFIRNGHKMSGHMSNVGDICKSPQKILVEGAKLLRSRLGCWGVSREYYETLTRLSELRKVT